MNDLQRRIQERIDVFVEEINALVREVATAMVTDALSSAAGTIGAPATRSGAVKAPRAPRASAKAPATPRAPKAAVREKGAKRKPAEIEKTTRRLAAFIAEHGGLRIEQIGKEMGEQTKDLTLSIKRLIEQGAIRTEGDRRSTKYFPVKKDAAASAPAVEAPAGEPKSRGKGKAKKK